MTIIGGINYDDRGIVQNIRAMRMQNVLMSITNDNVTGFDKIGYQRKIPVISSFAEFIGPDAISTVTDDGVGRLGLTQKPLDFALADKGYFQILTKEGIKLTRDGRFKVSLNGSLVNLEGNQVLSNMGSPIVLPFVPEQEEDIKVDLNGVIRVLDNKTRKFVNAGTISVVTSEGLAVLNPNIRQGYQEYSNVNLQSEFMQAMQYPKTFEANRQMYLIQNANLQKAISYLSN